MTENEYKLKEAVIPPKWRGKFGYGLYGGVVQYYIKGVDGTVAQLGYTFPPTDSLAKIFEYAKKQHNALLRGK